MIRKIIKIHRQPSPSLQNAVRALLPCLLLFAATAGTVAAAPAGKEAPAPLVTVTPVSVRDINTPTEHVGHVEAIQEVALRDRVSGFL